MPLWDRWFSRRVEEEPLWRHVSEDAHRALARGDDPRHSAPIAYWLRLLWKQESLGLSQLQLVLFAGRLPHSPLTSFLYTYVNRHYQPPPDAPEAVHAAIVAGLGHYLSHKAAQVADRAVTETNGTIAGGILETVQLAQLLQAWELEAICCDLLTAVHGKLSRLAHGSDKGPIAAYQSVRDALYECLAGFPADKMPTLWERLKTARGGEEFRHVVARIRDRNAVPYLLALLPEGNTSDDGERLDVQAVVVNTLRNIGDGRAVPRLQMLAAHSNSLLSRPAHDALTAIMARSQDDAAQLLRPTDSRHAGNAGETLLRPAHDTPSSATAHPDQLLRPGHNPDEPEKEP